MDEFKVLNIRMLGGLEIEYDGRVISSQELRTKQLWLLMSYLIINKGKVIATDKLCQMLWDVGEIDKPKNALKNLVYRLRTLLSKLDGDSQQEYVLSKRGGYYWNSKLEYNLDLDKFQEDYKIASDVQLVEEKRIEYYSSMMRAYRGNCLEEYVYESWVELLGTQYRNLYFKAVIEFCELLEEKGDFSTVLKLSTKALELDPFREELQAVKLKSMSQLGYYEEAARYYSNLTDRYFKELGVKPGKRLSAIYQTISQRVKYDDAGIEVVFSDLTEDIQEAKGAYKCGYEVFRHIYHVYVRSIERTGRSLYLCLFTIEDKEQEEIDTKTRERVMEHLQKALMLSFRKSDIISRFSPTQCVALMPSLTYESTQYITRRIQINFNHSNRPSNIVLRIKFMPVTPEISKGGGVFSRDSGEAEEDV